MFTDFEYYFISLFVMYTVIYLLDNTIGETTSTSNNSMNDCFTGFTERTIYYIK